MYRITNNLPKLEQGNALSGIAPHWARCQVHSHFDRYYLALFALLLGILHCRVSHLSDDFQHRLWFQEHRSLLSLLCIVDMGTVAVTPPRYELEKYES